METNSKTKNIVTWVLVGLLSAIFLMSGVMKLTRGEEIVKNFAGFGLEGRELLIGFGEIASALLFLLPRTSSLGVLLLSGYMGGAIATHMEHGQSFVAQSVILVVIWAVNYLRNPEMLASFKK